jgi:glycosyltransferase involved in cell wall biosynthesis
MQVEYQAGNKTAGVLTQPIKTGLPEVRSCVFPGQKEAGAEKVSAVIITLNEAAIIADTISRLWWCDEIIIIDSGSTDDTVRICEELGCSVFFRSFNGFGEQKNFGVSKIRNDWVLCIDADEILTEPLIDEIRAELKRPDNVYAAFAIPRNLVFMNKVFEHGRESHSSLIRLFNKKKGSWDGAVVHEKVSVEGAVKNLKNKILHYSYHDYSQFLSKINLYSSLGSRKLFAKGSNKGKAVIILAIPFNFFKYYIIDRNFLNGYKGFVWAVFNTFYHFVKYLKLSELKRKEIKTASL